MSFTAAKSSPGTISTFIDPWRKNLSLPLLLAGVLAVRSVTNAPPNRSRCLIATAGIANERPAQRFLRWCMCRRRHSKSRKAHHAIIRLPASPVATINAAFARTAVPDFSAVLVTKDKGFSLRVSTIRACSSRRCISGHPTRSRGIKWIRRCPSLRNMHREISHNGYKGRQASQVPK